jgi:hypothetical protein
MKCPSFVNKNNVEIDYTCYVYTRPNLRDGIHEMNMFIGKYALDNMFDKKIVDTSTNHIEIYYPETFCNIPELQCLTSFITYFYPNLEKLIIHTHSVYILQTTRKEHILISDDSAKFPAPTTIDANMRFCNPPEALKGLWANGKKIT